MPAAQTRSELERPVHLVEVPHETVVALRPDARRRDVSVERLIADLLAAIIAPSGTGTLVAAVLDDQPAPSQRARPGRPRKAGTGSS
jgi:hypothetical protein